MMDCLKLRGGDEGLLLAVSCHARPGVIRVEFAMAGSVCDLLTHATSPPSLWTERVFEASN